MLREHTKQPGLSYVIAALFGVLMGAGTGAADTASPEEETTAPGNYTGLRQDYLGRDIYSYPSSYGDRYIRYGAANQGRRAVFDRLG